MTTQEAIRRLKYIRDEWHRKEDGGAISMALDVLEKQAEAKKPKRLAPFPWHIREGTFRGVIEDANGVVILGTAFTNTAEQDNEIIAHILKHSQGEPDDGKGAPQPAESAWLLEKSIDGIPHWFTGKYYNDLCWSRDSTHAMRFARREDAARFLSEPWLASKNRIGAFVSEHCWFDPPKPKSEPVIPGVSAPYVVTGMTQVTEQAKVFDDMESLIDDLNRNDPSRLVPNPITGQMQEQPKSDAVDPAIYRCLHYPRLPLLSPEQWKELFLNISRTLNLPEIRRLAEHLVAPYAMFHEPVYKSVGQKILACLDGKEASK